MNLITSESITVGHPDKMCDLISDSILTEYLKGDKDSRVACEVMATSKKVIVSGEITSKVKVDVLKIVRDTITSIGYDNDDVLYNGHTIPIDILLNTQSPDISMGVNKEEIGAGDQGLMFGYATNETDNFMPITLYYANKLSERLEFVRKNGVIPYLYPDGKTQVTFMFDDENKPLYIDTIVVSSQHKDIDIEVLRRDIKKYIIDEVIPSKYLVNDTKIYINPTGRFVIGGPVGDTGLTGRKIIVDTYGGIIPHGGGAFSGKDYTKVDRTAAYYARYVCKNIVASGLCNKLMISVSYAIGVSHPLSIYVDVFDNVEVKDKVMNVINKFFDFSPSNMINELKLKELDYRKTTCYSHFGKEDLPYEKLDKVREIKKYLSK